MVSDEFFERRGNTIDYNHVLVHFINDLSPFPLHYVFTFPLSKPTFSLAHSSTVRKDRLRAHFLRVTVLPDLPELDRTLPTPRRTGVTREIPRVQPLVGSCVKHRFTQT